MSLHYQTEFRAFIVTSELEGLAVFGTMQSQAFNVCGNALLWSGLAGGRRCAASSTSRARLKVGCVSKKFDPKEDSQQILLQMPLCDVQWMQRTSNNEERVVYCATASAVHCCALPPGPLVELHNEWFVHVLLILELRQEPFAL